ncbi:cysteine-rich receptor-like protein kinase 10 [Herrania umbratica]|uniref:Cysteine-rich receptor-like protein kinase 10 n=1 Tax=Herrania umbratica TaxID=108875 RepID=A0A6J1AT67_9ROSI|nr:cysteine-rich receptor-like protein kinase 10 [Herrania umbratica]
MGLEDRMAVSHGSLMSYPSFVLLISTIILFSLSFSTAQSNGCSERGEYSANSAYSRNLNLILSSLHSNVSVNGGFYNTSTGQGPDEVYALALCRGDLASGSCFDCINSSSEGIKKQCPNQKEAIFWGPGISSSVCMLRYSNRNIFSAMEVTPSIPVTNPNDISANLEQFNETLHKLMGVLLTEASSGSTSKFAAGDMNFTSSEKIYGLVQCTPDISKSDCRICLQGAIGELSECCGRKQGGRILRPSCIAWFELNLFYDSNTIDAPSLSPPGPSTSVDIVPPVITNNRESSRTTSRTTIIIVVSVVILLALAVIVSILCCILYKWKAKLNRDDDSAIRRLESLQFSLTAVKTATNDFHDANRLGQGGFGSVYKGMLQNGQEIAVKRLSRHSSQGELEFKNEILLVAKLQHRNLVRLMGFCLEGTERILVYEFVSNGSLDQYIFDSIKRGQLNWEMCYKIICAIARGILYLHEDSCLRIIHRDLKASNVLLDEEMNPKISDFGMARLFAVNQIQGNTARTVGTYGYMAPEYALHGQFSVKSDVFSFGILLLEIVSGKKNSWMNDSGELEHLPSYAWKNWREGTAENLIDPTLGSSSKSIIMRCIHVGLLCIQEHAAKRPTMASVVLMLNSNSLSLPPPMQPAFLMYGSMETSLPSSQQSSGSSQSGQSTDRDATPYFPLN